MPSLNQLKINTMKKFFTILLLVCSLSNFISAQKNSMDFVVTSECLAASNETNMNEMSRVCNRRDEPALMKMIERGQVYVLKSGTNVRLVKGGITMSTITVLDGANKGATLVISPEFMRKK